MKLRRLITGPNGVKCKYNDGVIVNTLSVNFFYEQIEGWERYVNHTLKYDVEDIKPYLFPLSSMTEEQKQYISNRWGINEDFDFEIDPNWGEYFVDLCDAVDYINWLNENHFDYRGLIPKGLAIDATGLNIY